METKIKVALTAEEWELYTSSMKCGMAARKLNAAASKAIATAFKVYKKTLSSSEAVAAAWAVWSPVSNSLSDFGASDTEPRYHFEGLLIKHFFKPVGLEYNYW